MPPNPTLPTYTYLYAFDLARVAALKGLPYEIAISLKISAAKSLLKVLLDVPLMSRDNTRINAVYKAIKFNQSLLEELK